MSLSFSSVIAFLFCAKAFAGTAAPVYSATTGAGVSTDSVTLQVPITEITTTVCLIAGNEAAGSQSYLGFYSMNAPVSQSQYQVPSGKSFNIKNINYLASPGGCNYVVGFADSVVSENVNIDPLNPIFFGSGSGVATYPIRVQTNNFYYSQDVSWKIPTQKFPFMRSDSTTATLMVLCGLEQ